MNIQIFYLKRNFDVQKAERYFKERRLSYHLVDMAKRAMSKRELESVQQQVGIRAMIDTESKLYQTHHIRMLTGDGPILDALQNDARLLKTPIVRNGKKATVGYAPDIWAEWKE